MYIIISSFRKKNQLFSTHHCRLLHETLLEELLSFFEKIVLRYLAIVHETAIDAMDPFGTMMSQEFDFRVLFA